MLKEQLEIINACLKESNKSRAPHSVEQLSERVFQLEELEMETLRLAKWLEEDQESFKSKVEHRWEEHFAHCLTESPAAALYQKILTILKTDHDSNTRILLHDPLGISPQKAIELLIKILILEKESITGSRSPDKQTQNDIKAILDYFYDMPDLERNRLKALPIFFHITLGTIIEVLAHDLPREEAAPLLRTLLIQNPDTPILIAPAETTTIQSNSINYNRQILKESKRFNFYQEQLLPRVMSEMRIRTIEELLYLLNDLHPKYYDCLWKHFYLEESVYQLSELAEAISFGFFNTKQNRALADAICSNYSRFESNQSRLLWASQTGDLAFIDSALQFIPKEEQSTALLEQELLEKAFPLYHALGSSRDSAVFLNLWSRLSESEQDEALKKELEYMSALGKLNLLHASINKPDILNILLSRIPIDQRLKKVTQDAPGGSLWYRAVQVPTAITCILDLLPEEERMTLLLFKDSLYGDTLLHMSIDFEISLITILEYVKNHQDRLKLYLATNQFGSTPMHCTVHGKYPALQALQILISHFPKIEGAGAILLIKRDNENNRILDYLKTSPKAQECFLREVDICDIEVVEKHVEEYTSPDDIQGNKLEITNSSSIRCGFFSPSISAPVPTIEENQPQTNL